LFDLREEIKIGTEYYHLKAFKWELKDVFTKGEEQSSPLFKDKAGNFFKTGFVPIKDQTEQVRACLAVETSAFFMADLRKIRRRLTGFILFSATLTLIISLIMGYSITSSLRDLVFFARQIARGNFSYQLRLKSKDEIGFLGKTMEEMRKNLIQRDENMKMMLASVAHEIRNPLGSIEVLAEAIRPKLKNPKDLTFIENLIKEVKSLNQIITDFLSFSRPGKIQPEKTNLNFLISQALSSLAGEIEKKKIKVEKKLSSSPLTLFLDREQFKKVFINLFLNAFQSLRAGGELKVETVLRPEKVVRISIKDNGEGIKEEHLPHIFEPFFTTRKKGAGLGLALVKRVVEAHQGKILAKSKLHQGTEIIIELPSA
jgi:signal transduction histidine kinase